MPIWLIRTRDDQGNTELIKVRAESAADAVRLAEVDFEIVYSIENELGTGRGKYDRSMGIIQVAVTIIGSLFVSAVLWKSLIKWSDINTYGRIGIIVLGAIFALGMLSGVAYRVCLFVQRRKNGGDTRIAEPAEVLLHKSTNWQMYHYMIQHPVVRMMYLLGAIGVGIAAISQIGGEEAVNPFLIVMPLVFLYFAAIER